MDSTFYLPVAAEGALFYVGDPHHAMGPGEGTHCDGGFPARHLPPVGLQEGVWGCPVGRLPPPLRRDPRRVDPDRPQ
ncbi:acetamidase/formamidase family protein [Actinomyces haliotis]|uniref:acetamidase/formamidase family protein n=1 Tax=Actinomyces haliotis TaxID=1280843 RepID=UPI001CED352E